MRNLTVITSTPMTNLSFLGSSLGLPSPLFVLFEVSKKPPHFTHAIWVVSLPTYGSQVLPSSYAFGPVYGGGLPNSPSKQRFTPQRVIMPELLSVSCSLTKIKTLSASWHDTC